MATLKTQTVVGDSGSQQMAQLIKSYNNLLDVVGTLITALKTVALIGDVNTAATTAETSLQSLVYKQAQSPNIPLSPAPPAV